MLNYQTVDFLKSQLREQYDRSGYSYEKPQDVDRILEAQAAKLAASGVSSIYDVGLKEVPNTNTVNQVFRVGNDLYYRQEEDEGPGYNVKIDPSRVLDIAADTPVREETEGGQPIFQDRFQVTLAEDPTKYLINKQTGQEIPKVGLKSNWKEDPTAFNVSKPEPIVSRNGYERYGFDTSVEGQADYSVQFVNGNPLFLPAYKSTKTDPTPYLLIAAALGAPYLFGTTAAPAAAGTAGTAGAGTGTTLATSTAVPGSFQAALPSLGVNTAATTAASTAIPGSFQAALPGLLASTAGGAPIYFANAVPAEQVAYPATQVGAGATPVPGSYQARLAELGVETAATTAPATAAPGSFQAAVPSLLSNTAAASGTLDTLRTINSVRNMLTQPTVQQQAGLLSGGGQARGVDFSPLYQNTQVGLLPLAERYRRSLI